MRNPTRSALPQRHLTLDELVRLDDLPARTLVDGGVHEDAGDLMRGADAVARRKQRADRSQDRARDALLPTELLPVSADQAWPNEG